MQYTISPGNIIFETAEQKFVPQICGDNCTCHKLITEDISKDIPEAIISAHLIRGVELDAGGNIVEKTEIGKQNANVHNFLAHLKYRILGAENMPMDEALSIFKDPPQVLTIHDNGFDKKTEISEDQQAILDRLNELTIGTPADIKTFAEKITQIDCNTDGLDKLINQKIKEIKGVIREYNKNNSNKQLTLDDISTAYLKEDIYKKALKQIVENELAVKDNTVTNLTEKQATDLSENNDLIKLNNEYKHMLSENGLFIEVNNLIDTKKKDKEKKPIVERILELLGIQAGVDMENNKSIQNNLGGQTDRLVNKENKNGKYLGLDCSNLLKKPKCSFNGVPAKQKPLTDVTQAKKYGYPYPPELVNDLVSLNAICGISYGGNDDSVRTLYNYNRFLNIKSVNKKYSDFLFNNAGTLPNSDFCGLFSKMSLYASIDKCINIINKKDKICDNLISDFKTSFLKKLHTKAEENNPADILLFLINNQQKIDSQNDITPEMIIANLNIVKKKINNDIIQNISSLQKNINNKAQNKPKTATSYGLIKKFLSFENIESMSLVSVPTQSQTHTVNECAKKYLKYIIFKNKTIIGSANLKTIY